MKRSYIFLIYIILLTIFSLLYLSLYNESNYDTKNIIGKRIDNIDLKLFNNNKFNTKELSNHEFTLINFWASWCAPCRKEHSNLVKLSKNKNLKIVGVNFKDDETNASLFLQEMGNPFYILTKDPEGKKSVNFGVYGIPETILINKDLVILKKYIGPLDQSDVNEINRAVK